MEAHCISDDKQTRHVDFHKKVVRLDHLQTQKARVNVIFKAESLLVKTVVLENQLVVLV